jgi:hypothetical protein
MHRLFPPLSLIAALGACATAPSFESGVYRDGPLAFRVGALPDGWRRVSPGVGGGAVAFHHAAGGTIAAGASCDRSDDAPLDVLTNHLLIGVEGRRDLAREELTLDGRAALRTRVEGRVDGVPVGFDLVVVRKDGCTYDLHLVAGPAAADARRPDFDRFLAGFATVGTP